MAAHPDGTGTGWTLTETIDVDQPHGLDYRALIHLAKAVRKRNDKEHQAYGDATAGGEHVPGWCKVLKHVDATADVSGAKDATLFQYNGIVHSASGQTLWCITGASGDATILLLDPDKQYKGGDITWTGAQQFDASVDMTILKCVSGTFQILVVDSSANLHGPADMTDTQIDGTLTVLDRADFSTVNVAGDFSCTGGAEFDASVALAGPVVFGSSNVYDSTWFDCSIVGTYTKTHDLSSTALLLLLYFKDVGNGLGLGANRVYAQYAPWLEANTENGATINNLTTTQVTIQAGADNVAYCFSTAGQKVYCNTGQYRIIGLRLV